MKSGSIFLWSLKVSVVYAVIAIIVVKFFSFSLGMFGMVLSLILYIPALFSSGTILALFNAFNLMPTGSVSSVELYIIDFISLFVTVFAFSVLGRYLFIKLMQRSQQPTR